MMNERTLELAKQATKEVWGNNPHNGAPEFEGYELDQEKFAELIVAECMKVTKDYTCNQGWDYSAPVALARHFGVGE